MFSVVKSNGKREKISFQKISNRIEKQNGLSNLNLDTSKIIQNVYGKLYDGISSDQIELEIIQTLAHKNYEDPHFDILASRLFLTHLHKRLPSKFSLNFKKLFDNQLVDRVFYRFVKKNARILDETVDLKRDFLFDSMIGLTTFQRLYLLKNKDTKKLMECPQYCLMRVAINVGYVEGIDMVLQIYDRMSQQDYTHASPTIFNACTKQTQLSSCFLLTVGDSIEGIFETLKTVALISKTGGGVGIDFSHVRGKNAPILSTNGMTNGTMPFIEIYDKTTVVNQSSRRSGSFALFMKPSHPDFMDFLELLEKKPGPHRARQLFYGIWASDTFMKMVKDPQYPTWYFFDPSEVPELYNTYGEEHWTLYQQAVKDERYVASCPTFEVWSKILDSQVEHGMPYMLFADTANQHSNLKHVAPIKSSNLCVEGDTLLLTDMGYFPIKTLENETVQAWNGENFSEVIVRKTSERAAMKKIFFNCGIFLRCTAQHRFYVQRGSEIVVVEAQDLRKGMVLEAFDIPKNTFCEHGEVHFDVESKEIPFQGSKKQIEQWLQHHFKTTKNKSHMENLAGFLLSQQISGSTGIQIFVYKIESEVTYGPTYCATEPKRGRLCFNGMVTGNCAEIMLPASDSEIAVCNLASINLTNHVEDNQFNFDRLEQSTRQLVRNLNQVVDVNAYPHPKAKTSNFNHRPIGIGVSGLADTFYLHHCGYGSERAKELNFLIFERIYWSALDESNQLALEFPEKIPPSFKNSALAKGQVQFDLYKDVATKVYPRLTLDWVGLRQRIQESGLINTMFTCCMPTASTASIFGNYEGVEPPMSIVFNRSTNGGLFPIVNKYLVKQLQKLNLWTESIQTQIKQRKSIQSIPEIPQTIKDIFKTNWELDQEVLVDLAIDRQYFMDHSQSLNLSFAGANAKQQITRALYKGWEGGLKTGSYYIRTKPAVEQSYATAAVNRTEQPPACSIDNKDCSSCSS